MSMRCIRYRTAHFLSDLVPFLRRKKLQQFSTREKSAASNMWANVKGNFHYAHHVKAFLWPFAFLCRSFHYILPSLVVVFWWIFCCIEGEDDTLRSWNIMALSLHFPSSLFGQEAESIHRPFSLLLHHLFDVNELKENLEIPSRISHMINPSSTCIIKFMQSLTLGSRFHHP